ncbi:hypothetical protein [Nostoc sp. CCY 9925]|uniref:hypothetical protein n=1 Tax=Nostoc sp. CCY 9925 TaxID=3103865 RepID=UPI0039C719E7
MSDMNLEQEITNLKTELDNFKLEEKKKSVRNALYKAGVDDAHLAVNAFGQDYDLKNLDLTNINQLVTDWKNSSFGSKFFKETQIEEPTTKPKYIKELSQKLKEGSIKLKLR